MIVNRNCVRKQATKLEQPKEKQTMLKTKLKTSKKQQQQKRKPQTLGIQPGPSRSTWPDLTIGLSILKAPMINY